MAKECTADCLKSFRRGQGAIKDLAVNLKTAFPKATDFDITLSKEVNSYATIGEINFTLGEDCYIRLRFNGVGKSSWSSMSSWTRYKVAIGGGGIWNDNIVYEKQGKLDYEKVIEIIKNRYQGFSDRQNAAMVAKVNREVSEKVVESLGKQLDEIRGYTRIDCEDDGSFKLTLTNLDEGRLRRIVGALTIHHAK